jgi:hypothetical protein
MGRWVGGKFPMAYPWVKIVFFCFLPPSLAEKLPPRDPRS